MKLTIITCTYNSESTIKKCIDSVVFQWLDSDEYEHIFVDANSTDKTIDIINKEYHNKNNYTILSSKPQWAYNAMNIWISHAKWSYIYLLNSDDAIYTQGLSTLFAYTIKNNSDFCFGNTRYVDNHNILLRTIKPKMIFPFFMSPKLYKSALFLMHYCCPQATIYKKTLHQTVWSYNESYKFLSDREFSIKVSWWNYRSHYMDIDVCEFLVHSNSLTSNKDNTYKMNTESIQIINHHFWYGLWILRLYLIKGIKTIL